MKGHRHMNDLVAIIVWALIFGAITAAIAHKKNLGNVGGWFVGGAMMFIVALPMVIFAKPGLPPAPPGMRVVKCPRCNTVQNIPASSDVFECWQCKYMVSVTVDALIPIAAGWYPDTDQSELERYWDGRSWTSRTRKFMKVQCYNCEHVQAVPQSQQTFVCEQCNTEQDNPI
jgi:ribosomal protein S27E